MEEKIDWKKYEGLSWSKYTPEEIAEDTVAEVQPKWDIPEKVCVQCTISGGGARLHTANPNQPRNLDDIRDQAVAVIETGASVVHFDFDLRACRTRDGKEMPSGEAYLHVVKPLIEKYGRERLIPHINCMRGTFEQQMLPIVSGVAELTYVHPKASPTYNGVVIPLLKKHGVKGGIRRARRKQEARGIGQSARLNTAQLYARRHGGPGQAVLMTAGTVRWNRGCSLPEELEFATQRVRLPPILLR